MTPKIQSLAAAIIAGVSGLLSHVASISPSLQDNLVQHLQAVFPVAWRPEIASICGLVSTLALIYAIRQASHSGPASAPANDPQTGAQVPPAAPVLDKIQSLKTP